MSSSNEDNSGELPTVYSCRKCEGKFYRSDEIDEHKAYHRRLRQERRGSRRRQRSPAASSTGSTLFVVHERTPPPEIDTSQRARRSRAKTAHNKSKGKVMNKRNPGA